LLRESGERAAALVAEHTVTAQARAHADAVVAEAEERASVIRAEADTYARDVMLRLEEHLMRAVTTVRKGAEMSAPTFLAKLTGRRIAKDLPKGLRADLENIKAKTEA